MARYFTFVNNLDGSTRWSEDYHLRRDALGLYLVDTEKPLETPGPEVTSSEVVKSIFGHTVTVVPKKQGWVLTNSAAFLDKTPDRAKEGDGIVVHDGGKEHFVDLRVRYNNCFELVKQSLGCGECPLRGAVCMSRALPKDVTPGKNPTARSFNIGEALKGTRIGDFEYVSPSYTRSHDFEEPLRSVEKHDFDEIATWKRRMSERGQLGAQSKQFREKVCGVCPVSDHCTNYRFCTGPYPGENVLTEKVLSTWRKRYNDKHLNPFEPWQFWVLAASGGIEAKWRQEGVIGSRPRRTLFTGLVWEGKAGGFRAAAQFCRGDTGEAFCTTKYDDVARWFNLPRTKEEAYRKGLGKRPTSKLDLALFLHSLETRYGNYRQRGFHRSSRERINFRILKDNCFHIGFSAGSRWNARGYDYRVSTWSSYWSNVHTQLPCSQKQVRQGRHARMHAIRLQTSPSELEVDGGVE